MFSKTIVTAYKTGLEEERVRQNTKRNNTVQKYVVQIKESLKGMESKFAKSAQDLNTSCSVYTMQYVDNSEVSDIESLFNDVCEALNNDQEVKELLDGCVFGYRVETNRHTGIIPHENTSNIMIDLTWSNLVAKFNSKAPSNTKL